MAWSFVSGHLGRDPERKQTQNGSQFVAFSVAENSMVAGKKITTWYNCTMWGGRADTLQQHFHQGSAIEVVGNVTENEYRANDGTMKKSLSMYCWDWKFPPSNNPNGGQQGGGGQQFQPQQQGQFQNPAPQQAAPQYAPQTQAPAPQYGQPQTQPAPAVQPAVQQATQPAQPAVNQGQYAQPQAGYPAAQGSPFDN